MEKIRTFLAVPVKVDTAFLAARSRLMEGLKGERISWVHPHHFHITIRFLGDLDRDRVEEVATAIDDMVRLPAGVACEWQGPGLFGPRKKPRVIWVGFQSQEFLSDLRKEVDRALASCGMPFSEQGFRAHLTLGRIRSVRNPAIYREWMEGLRHDFTGWVRAERLVFFRSELRKGGPVYSALKEWKFA